MKKTKIICSIGPASNKVEVMEQMVLVGMNDITNPITPENMQKAEMLLKTTQATFVL